MKEAGYPNHSHPAGEEIYVVKGEVRFGADNLHSADLETGWTMLFIVPEEVVILK